MIRTIIPVVVLIAVDFAVIFAASAGGWWLRFDYNLFSLQYPEFIPFTVYLRVIPFYGLIWLFFLSAFGSYRDPLRVKLPAGVLAALKSATAAMLVIAAVSFVLRNSFYSRLAMVYTWALGIAGIAAARSALKASQYLYHNSSVFVRNVVLIGDAALMRSVEGRLSGNPFVRVSGRFPGDDAGSIVEDVFSAGARDVFVCHPLGQWHKIRSIVEECVPAGINVQVVSDFLNIPSGRIAVRMVDGMPVLEFGYGLLTAWNRRLKRATDVVLTVAGTIALLPLYALIALLIRIDSPGPVFFRQTRVGQGGKKFRILKFRSMHVDAELRRRELTADNQATFPIFKIADDPRITRVGKALRRFYLDELPQLWNVLAGEMSLVGPRPLPDYEADRLSREQKKRMLVPPGITGLWQVTPSAKLSTEEMIALDMSYIERWNVLLDARIMLKTLPLILGRKGI